MKRWLKLLLLVLLIVIVAGLALITYILWDILPVATGYTAKALCSNVFLTGQDPETVMRELPDNPLIPLLRAEVDQAERIAAVSVLGLFARQHGVYRNGLGCTLIAGRSRADTLARPDPQALAAAPLADPAAPWPLGEAVSPEQAPPEVDQARLAQVLDEAMSEPFPDPQRRTRAVVVVHDGQLVGERYAPGYSKDTPLLGWSMTKSVTNALIGILAAQGRLDIAGPAPAPEWSDPADSRRAITIDQLLRMSSGLEFSEDYADLTVGVTQMLYHSPDMAHYAASMPLRSQPDGEWYYSSGSANIVSRIIRQTVGGNDLDYWAFPRRALFDRLGMRSAVMEPDASGTFVGSSYMYATARDWARFGLLFLQDGVWNGQRILPQGWVDYTKSPTLLSNGEYGAHWWLNAGTPGDPASKEWPDLPDDLYYASGHDGQIVAVIPSRKVVVVRLGLTRDEEAWDEGQFIAGVLSAIAPP